MKEWVISHPYTAETVLDEKDTFLILACDGVNQSIFWCVILIVKMRMMKVVLNTDLMESTNCVERSGMCARMNLDAILSRISWIPKMRQRCFWTMLLTITRQIISPLLSRD